MPSALLGAITALITIFGFLYLRKSTTSGATLPPGPRPIPVLGNIFDLKLKEFWLDVTRWGHEYGDLTHVHVFGTRLIYLNTAEVASDLLDKRGAIYSDKPHMIMAGELCGCDQIIPFKSYGDEFRRQRKLMHTTLGSKEIPRYHQWLQQETHTFIRQLIGRPSGYMKHIRDYAGGLALAVVYGYRPTSSEDEFLLLAKDCLELLSNRILGNGGIWPVDIFPFLRYIPSWFPGGGFKQEARDFRQKYQRFAEAPFKYAKTTLGHMGADDIRSFCTTVLQDQDSESISREMEDDIKWSANAMLAASADTTIATVCHFILAMVEHPEVLEKAQQEIDEVVPRGSLPTFADRKSLPYVECIFKETLRWGVPVPLNLPHSVREDDTYRGMLIPKDSILIANIWAIMRNEDSYKDAHSFVPERFLGESDAETERKRDPRSYVFGFGRRRCPGADLVDSSIWLLIASMLAALRITPAVTSDGILEAPRVSYDNSVFRIPNPFAFGINLREGYQFD